MGNKPNQMIVVWHDPNIESEANKRFSKELFNMGYSKQYLFSDVQSVMQFMQPFMAKGNKGKKDRCLLFSSG